MPTLDNHVPRTYIAGPITLGGYLDPEPNLPAFAAAATALEAAGHVVVSPADIGERDGWDWHDYMRAAMSLMLGCRRVALLPGWESSRGAAIEEHLARHVLRMDVRPLHEWLEVGR